MRGSKVAEGNGPVTLATIAQLSGFHVSTVSRALNSRGAEGVSEESAATIQRIAEDLGYQPNVAGRALRTGRSFVVGVVVPHLTDFVLATIYGGIEAAAARRGFETVVANSGDDPAMQQRRAASLIARQVDGLIFGDARLDSPNPRTYLDRHIPIVMVSRRLPRQLSVTTDDPLGGRLAGEHIAALGHRVVGVIAGQPFASTSLDRTQGFVDACKAAGLATENIRVVHGAFDVGGGPRGSCTTAERPSAPHRHLRCKRLRRNRRHGRGP